MIHFGKNKGVRLGDLSRRQLMWYANDWQLQENPSEYDHRLKRAAVALEAGFDNTEDLLPNAYAGVEDDGIPF